jgi:hypothetical protein
MGYPVRGNASGAAVVSVTVPDVVEGACVVGVLVVVL